jgi:hypothetical protein
MFVDLGESFEGSCTSPEKTFCQAPKLRRHFGESIFLSVAAMERQQLQFGVTEVARKQVNLDALVLVITQARTKKGKQNLSGRTTNSLAE